MFATLLLLSAALGLATAEIPSYIHVCHRGPQLDKCIASSAMQLLPKLCEGIPELDIPPIEPMLIDEMLIIDTPQLYIISNDIKVHGLGTVKLGDIHLDFDQQTFVAELVIRELDLNAKYTLKANILFPIERHGTLNLRANNVNAKISTLYKIINHNGQHNMYYGSVSTKLQLKNYTANIELDNTDKIIQTAINDMMGKNQREVLNTIKPNIEVAIGRLAQDLVNKIFMHFSFEELYPEP